MTYGNWSNRTFETFCSSFSSNSVELAYRQSGTSTLLGFYMKRLLYVAYVILDQENLRNFAGTINREISLFVGSHFI